MTDNKICAKCGIELPVNAPAGVCPRCLLQAGMLESSLDIANAAIDATILTDSTAPSDRAIEPPTVRDEKSSRPTPETGENVRYFGEYELLEEIAIGGFGLSGYVARIAPGASPFEITPPSQTWLEALHGFSWLRQRTGSRQQQEAMRPCASPKHVSPRKVS